MSTLDPPVRSAVGAHQKPAPRLASAVATNKKPKRTESPTGPALSAGDTPAKQSPDPTKSSAGFRAQIAKAKAAHRAAGQGRSSGSPLTTEFEACEDPFNQGPQGQSALAQRIDGARRDGRLNITALDLKKIPEEVLQMYDAEAMEASTVAWSETIDLVRLNAADNSIEELPDDIFPDMTPEELSTQNDAKGNQFGGLESLDLHGNLLADMPLGLRRLGRLTKLDLVSLSLRCKTHY